ncbi:MAG: class II glutamine amidotransferase [Phycisphaerales bacterium]
MPTDARGPGQDRHAEAGSDAGKAARARGDIPLAVLASSARGSSVGHADWPRDSREKCAVFGVWTRTEQVGGSNGHAPTAGMLTYLGLYAQQHRGQEAAGIAGSDGRVVRVHTGTGLVPDVLTESVVRDYDKFATHGAIGHTRYSTAGGSLACNAQPFLESYVGGQVAIAHNGNLVNADALRKDFERRGALRL